MATMGRPRTFDRDTAVTQALHLFWEHGYDATSLSQLKASIGGGISAPSFYAAFGSKEALFKEVISRYLNTHGRVTDSLFDTSLPPREAIERCLRNSARMQCEPGHPRGCLVALGTMSSCSEESTLISAPLAEARAKNLAGIEACIERAIALEDLPAGTQVQAMAAMFNSFMLGLSTLARDGAGKEVLHGAVTQVMRVWPSITFTDLGSHAELFE